MIFAQFMNMDLEKFKMDLAYMIFVQVYNTWEGMYRGCSKRGWGAHAWHVGADLQKKKEPFGKEKEFTKRGGVYTLPSAFALGEANASPHPYFAMTIGWAV